MTSLVDPTMHRPKKKMTKAERLMTALYVTHYHYIHRLVTSWIGSSADDLISAFGEKLLKQPDLWDGKDEQVLGFLLKSLKRRALNHIRDTKKLMHECDMVADTGVFNGDDLKVWVKRSDAPDALVIVALEREELREMLRVASQDSPEETKKLRAEVFEEMLAEGFSGTEYARAHNLNINTIHAHARRIRSMCYDQKRLGGARPERVNPYS